MSSEEHDYDKAAQWAALGVVAADCATVRLRSIADTLEESKYRPLKQPFRNRIKALRVCRIDLGLLGQKQLGGVCGDLPSPSCDGEGNISGSDDKTGRTTNVSSTPARRAMTQRRGRAQTSDKAEMPNLGDWLRKVREHRRHTRKSAETRTGISDSYIKQIENEGLIPLRGVLDQLIVGYRLDEMQARFTRELAEPPVELAPIEELRDRVSTPDRLAALKFFDQVGIICVFTDPLWNVLVGNESFYRAEPDIVAAGHNVALWHFRPGAARSPAKDVALQWDYEATGLVALVRAGLGRYRDSPQAVDLLERLSASDEFNDRWQGGIQVAYGREPDDLCHMLDPVTREPFSVSIQVGELPDTRDIRFQQAIRRPYAGPPLS